MARNSEYVAERIARTWGLDATVIYPPVETTAVQRVADWRTELTGAELSILEPLSQAFLLGASRFIS